MKEKDSDRQKMIKERRKEKNVLTFFFRQLDWTWKLLNFLTSLLIVVCVLSYSYLLYSYWPRYILFTNLKCDDFIQSKPHIQSNKCEYSREKMRMVKTMTTTTICKIRIRWMCEYVNRGKSFISSLVCFLIDIKKKIAPKILVKIYTFHSENRYLEQPFRSNYKHLAGQCVCLDWIERITFTLCPNKSTHVTLRKMILPFMVESGLLRLRDSIKHV